MRVALLPVHLHEARAEKVGSREHSEPWSEGGGNSQLSWLFILTKPKRKKVAKRNKSAFP